MINLNRISRIGLGTLCLSAAMFMSSCSKEDASAPQPLTPSATSEANMKEKGPASFGIGNVSLANMPKTDGNMCENCFAPGWSAKYESEEAKSLAHAGTSSLKELWGYDVYWQEYLPSPGPGAIVTTSTYYADNTKPSMITPVIAKVTNLIPGKNYEINVQVATTRTLSSHYAKIAHIMLSKNSAVPADTFKDIPVDFTARPAKWSPITISFTAPSSEIELIYYVTPEFHYFNYANIYVGANAIKKLN